MSPDIQKGLIQESRFILEMTKRGIDVAFPFHKTHPYDYLIYLDGKWRTIQVKSSRQVDRGDGRKHKHITVQLTTRKSGKKQGRYKEGDFDLLFTTFQGRTWLIPFNKLGGNRMRCRVDTLRLKPYELKEEIKWLAT